MELIRNSSFYRFFSLAGYALGVLNIYISVLLVTNASFSLFFYILLVFGLMLFNFLLSSLTYMYLDIQKDFKIRGTDIFMLYGESLYILFFLIPVVYFSISKIISLKQTLVFISIIIFTMIIYRIYAIKKRTGIGYMNCVVAFFFPHIFFSFFMVLVLVLFIFSLYVFF